MSEPLDLAAAPFFDDVHTERAEEPGSFMHTYEFTMPANHAGAAFAVPKGMVIFPDLDGIVRAFTIRTVEEETSSDGTFKRVFAEDAAQDELLSLVHLPTTFTADTAREILDGVLAGSRWESGDVQVTDSDTWTIDIDTEPTWFDYITRWEAVCLLAAHYELEIETRVVLNGNVIAERYIDLIQRRGSYTGQVITYRGETQSMRRSGDGGEIYTAAIGLGEGSDGVYQTFSTAVWSAYAGDPVDKANGDIIVEDDTARYGDPNADPPVDGYGITLSDGSVVHRVGIYRDPEVTTATYGDAADAVLLQKTWDWLQEHTKPAYTYDVQIASLERLPAQRPNDPQRSWERIRVGDTVVVRDTAVYPPYTDEVRVIEVRRCYSDPTRDEFTLGKAEKRVSDYLLDSVLLKRKLGL